MVENREVRPPQQKTPHLQHLPFTILIDKREKAPYSFHNIPADKKHGGGIYQPQTETKHLVTGDYSIEGYERKISVERKSLSDLFSTLGQRRAQFRDEHRRLSYKEFGVVVVEATMQDIINNPPPYSKMNPELVYRTVLSWSTTCRVPYFFCGDRRFAEITTFRVLLRAWQKMQMTHKFETDK